MQDPIPAALVQRVPTADDAAAQLALMGWLAGYTGNTKRSYFIDLKIWSRWCADHGLALLEVRRAHIEMFAREQEELGKKPGTVARRLTSIAGYYRYCELEDVIIKSPATHVRRPKVSMESTTLGLDRMEMGGFLAAAQAGSPLDNALCSLLAITGLRVGEACGLDIGDISRQRDHRVISFVGKGGKLAMIPLAPRVSRAIDAHIGERFDGPIFVDRAGLRLNRYQATRIVRRIARRAGITKRISPHSLRHSFVTGALDAGVPLRDVQIGARHSDPRTTTRYDRARQNLDRHCTYVVAAYFAGGA